jgi:putative NIF3 family GTP cyclohydrolase 1 type 2
MPALDTIVDRLDQTYRLSEFDPDPSFGRWIPAIYEEAGLDWRNRFEAAFCERFNGLMVRGGETVQTVFCSVFPTEHVLDVFLGEATAGDLLFLHHPLDIECGDPQGAMGRGFLPIGQTRLDAIRDRRLSVYTCHTPMDLHPELGTNAAIIAALGGRADGGFWSYSDGDAGAVCVIEPVATHDLMRRARELFEIPYVDFAGRMHQRVERIAVVAGAGYKVDVLKDAEARGAQVYLSGEIFDRIDNAYGRRLFQDVQEFAVHTTMSLIGVSHASSEYLVMRTHMNSWFAEHCEVAVRLVPQPQWWR